MKASNLLLLHGALGAASQFDALAKALSENFEVSRFSFSGHGGREIPEVFSIRKFSEEVINFLDEHRIERTHIFGYSMGGYVALWTAHQYPQRAQSIFTLATKVDWNEESAHREAAMLNPEKMEAKIPAFADALRKRHQPHDWKRVVGLTAEMMLQLGKDHLNENDFADIACPVCISIGDRDNMVSLEESMDVYRKLSNGALCVLPSTPHPFEKTNVPLLAYHINKFVLKD